MRCAAGVPVSRLHLLDFRLRPARKRGTRLVAKFFEVVTWKHTKGSMDNPHSPPPNEGKQKEYLFPILMARKFRAPVAGQAFRGCTP